MAVKVEMMLKWIESKGYKIAWSERLPELGLEGVQFDFGSARRVFFAVGQSEEQLWETLAHEMGHIAMHSPQAQTQGSPLYITQDDVNGDTEFLRALRELDANEFAWSLLALQDHGLADRRGRYLKRVLHTVSEEYHTWLVSLSRDRVPDVYQQVCQVWEELQCS